MSNNLLTPFTLKDLELHNKIVMAPMTRCRADNKENKVSGLQSKYYTQRSGAGLIITEGSQISKQAVGYINTPGIYSEIQTEAWKLVTEAVHKSGGKIFLQLWHVGRMSHPDFHGGELPVAPSAINPDAMSFTPSGEKGTVAPRAMEIPEIEHTINDFCNAAKNAFSAGFDGVEIHASNGYLLHQFFAPCSNIRKDKYGGSIENRTRIIFELLDKMKIEVPIHRVGIRLNPSSHGFHGMTITEDTIPTFNYLIEGLNQYDLAYLHLSEPFTPVDDVPFSEPHIAKRYRPLYHGNLVINTGFTKETGDRVLKENMADLVAFGTPFIANPDLPRRFELGLELASPDHSTYYTPGPKGYTDYPFAE